MAPGDQTVTQWNRPRGKRAKPTLAQLGLDPDALDWQRSGTGDGSLEVAFVGDGAYGADGAKGLEGAGAVSWVLLRVAGDAAGRVLVYDRTEWICFLDGVGRGEFG